MAQHARLISGRLLIAGRTQPWHEWHADDFLDVCDTLREDEMRHVLSLQVAGAKIRLPQLPDVDTRRIPVRTSVGYGFVHHDPPGIEDDGTWGMDDESWEPSGNAESG